MVRLHYILLVVKNSDPVLGSSAKEADVTNLSAVLRRLLDPIIAEIQQPLFQNSQRSLDEFLTVIGVDLLTRAGL